MTLKTLRKIACWQNSAPYEKKSPQAKQQISILPSSFCYSWRPFNFIETNTEGKRGRGGRHHNETINSSVKTEEFDRKGEANATSPTAFLEEMKNYTREKYVLAVIRYVDWWFFWRNDHYIWRRCKDRRGPCELWLRGSGARKRNQDSLCLVVTVGDIG